jgi:hypothetical protein
VTDEIAKEEFLESNGFVYDYERMLFVSRTTRQVISREFIEDNSLARVQQIVQEGNSTGKWVYYFNQQPTPSVKETLEKALAG